MSRGFTECEGIRLQYRTVEEDGISWAVAQLAVDDEVRGELARCRLDLFEDPGDRLYSQWVDLVSELFRRQLSERAGVEGMVMRRRMPKDQRRKRGG